jgi:hypothetical protein
MQETNHKNYNWASRRGYWKHVLAKYDISYPELSRVRHELILASGFKCMMCGRDMSGGKIYNLEHSHQDHSIRAVTCWNCNRKLGNITMADLALMQAYLSNPPAYPLLPSILERIKADRTA